MINREAIHAALFAKLQAIPGVVTCSRILQHWADVPPELQPAVYMAQTRQVPATDTGEPSRWRLAVDVYVYVRTDGETPPGTLMNPILDAIENILAPHPITGRHQTLGLDAVHWARIDGAIETDEGTLGQQAVAIVPVLILAAG